MLRTTLLEPEVDKSIRTYVGKLDLKRKRHREFPTRIQERRTGGRGTFRAKYLDKVSPRAWIQEPFSYLIARALAELQLSLSLQLLEKQDD
jgi:hypothetical protein